MDTKFTLVCFTFRSQGRMEKRERLLEVKYQKVGEKVGLRPFRKGGIRIESSITETKKILTHNYGHGGGGITLSWGSVVHALELAKENINKYKNSSERSYKTAAVIGSGIIGMSTAYLLLKEGFSVTIYAESFPPNTTSNVAAGLWAPAMIDVGGSPSLYYQIVKTSFDYYEYLVNDEISNNNHNGRDDIKRLKKEDLQGVSRMFAYSFNEEETEFDYVVSKSIVPPPEEVILDFDNGNSRRVKKFKTLLVDTSIYLVKLQLSTIANGANLVHRKFNQEKEFEDLSEDLIFNCTGLGARWLCNDLNVYPVRGQLVYLQGDSNINYNVNGYSDTDPKFAIYLIPNATRLAVGGTFEEIDNPRLLTDLAKLTEVNADLSKKLVENLQSFYSPLTSKL